MVGVEVDGGGGAIDNEGGEINCANPGISAANLLIDRPPALPLPEVEEVLAPAAASGVVPVVDAVPTAMDLVVVDDDGATLMVARGTAASTLLLSEDGSLD